MKQLCLILSFMAFAFFASAQQAATTTANPQRPVQVMKADAKPSAINTTAKAAEPAKSCSGAPQPACTKGNSVPACCQKAGAGCHGAPAATITTTEKKTN